MYDVFLYTRKCSIVPSTEKKKSEYRKSPYVHGKFDKSCWFILPFYTRESKTRVLLCLRDEMLNAYHGAGPGIYARIKTYEIHTYPRALLSVKRAKQKYPYSFKLKSTKRFFWFQFDNNNVPIVRIFCRYSKNCCMRNKYLPIYPLQV